jgi:excisionase family DNA binding protein
MIKSLQDHETAYVTLPELAEYWGIGRKSVYRQVHEGALRAVRLGPRLVRVTVEEARRFERNAVTARQD